jgi:CubicO group peptidase (beta-lactamase class C family)
VLGPIRAAADVPALAGAIVTEEGAIHIGVTGVRKAGDPTPATLADPFHLGSDTKAMTGVVVAHAVDDGKLSFETTIAEVFPEWATAMDAAYREVTVDALLAHRSGLPANLVDWKSEAGESGVASRRRFAFRALQMTPAEGGATSGRAFLYSNVGFVVVAAMVERRTGLPWEQLIEQQVFAPLGIKGAGFGPAGIGPGVTAPWPHRGDGGQRTPISPSSPDADNPEVIDPAGRVHMPIEDWARFVADELRSFRGNGALLKPETYRHLHEPLFGGDYVAGWGVRRDPRLGLIYSHSGSNTMNFAIVTMVPERHVAFLVATNQGDGAAQSACKEALRALAAKRKGEAHAAP